MSTRFMAFLAVCAGALALVAPSAASGPAATSVSIQKNATLLNPMQVVVPLVVQCPAGEFAFPVVFVDQPQPVGPNTAGNGSTFLVCDGTHQTVNVTVNGGPFVVGNAFASARSLQGVDVVYDTKVVTIS
jgi:hypothetical protein